MYFMRIPAGLDLEGEILMTIYNLFGFQAEVDEEATGAWYADASKWGCECGHCRNFLALAEKKALPSPVLEALAALEIPPEKATYVCELYAVENGDCYQFSYRIAGNVLNAGENSSVQYDWGAGGFTHEIYPYGAPDFPSPHFDLEFFVTLPWILDEPHNP